MDRGQNFPDGRDTVKQLASRRLRIWRFGHRWTSLICTTFLLLICMTGLPLVFNEEINHWLNPHTYQALPANTPIINLDKIAAAGRQLYPRETLVSMAIDDDEPQIVLYLSSSWAALKANGSALHFIRFDARTGRILERPTPQHPLNFIGWMLRLHSDLFAGLRGELFMGLMALLFVFAIVSGFVLYGPFTRKMAFGTVRLQRPARVKWLDLHNLLGVTTLAWTLVVGATGIMNELSDPLFALWQRTEVEAMLAPWRGKEPPPPSELASVQGAFEAAKRSLPDMRVTTVVFPGAPLGSPYHYLVWGEGKTPLTSQLFSPALIDARTDKLTSLVRMPWYLRTVEISRPLHFGNYGGLPLKIIWALLDLVTIIVLGSGLYIWLARRRSASMNRVDELEQLEIEADLEPIRSAAE